MLGDASMQHELHPSCSLLAAARMPKYRLQIGLAEVQQQVEEEDLKQFQVEWACSPRSTVFKQQ